MLACTLPGFWPEFPLNMDEWALSRLWQNCCWVKASVQLILGVEVTESKIECQISLRLHIPAASAEDEWFTCFFIVNVFCTFFFLSFWWKMSSSKCHSWQFSLCTAHQAGCLMERNWNPRDSLKGVETNKSRMENRFAKRKLLLLSAIHTWQS